MYCYINIYVHFLPWCNIPGGPGLPHYRGFLITLRHTPLGRTSLDEWSARRKDLYLTPHNTHKRQPSMPPAGFEPSVPANERPQTHAWDRAATGIGFMCILLVYLKRYLQECTVRKTSKRCHSWVAAFFHFIETFVSVSVPTKECWSFRWVKVKIPC